MALPQAQMLTVGTVLAILLGAMAAGNVVARQMEARARARAGAAPAPAVLVGRYAVWEGAVVGRVVAVEGGNVVLEQEGARRRVPLAAARGEGPEVVLSQPPEA